MANSPPGGSMARAFGGGRRVHQQSITPSKPELGSGGERAEVLGASRARRVGGFRPRNTRRGRGGRQVRGGRRSLSTSSAGRLAHPGLAAGVDVAPAAAAAARVAEDDEALRPDGGHGDRRRDQAAPQSLDLQRDALRAAGVDDAVNLYHDLASGTRDDRPGLDSCSRPNPRSTSQTPSRPAADGRSYRLGDHRPLRPNLGGPRRLEGRRAFTKRGQGQHIAPPAEPPRIPRRLRGRRTLRSR